MSDVVSEENVGAEPTVESGGGDGPTPTPSPAAPPAGWTGPTQEDWQAMVGGMQYLAQRGYFRDEDEEEPDEDLSQADLGQLVERYVDTRLAAQQPILSRVQQEQGEKRLNELLDQFEGDPAIGKLSPAARKAAGWAAQALLPQLVDPYTGRAYPDAAERAVYMGAKEVAGMTKSEREAAVKEYQDSIKRPAPFSDPSVAGSGSQSLPPAKSYDEVISRWSGQEDV